MVAITAALLLLAAISGCRNGQKGEAQAPQPAARVQDLAASHNQRVQLLQTVHAEGRD